VRKLAVRIIAFIVCVAAALLTFRGEWILKTFTSDKEPSVKKIMALKYAALGLAVAAFAAVFLIK
jgi:hypothetical protein